MFSDSYTEDMVKATRGMAYFYKLAGLALVIVFGIFIMLFYHVGFGSIIFFGGIFLFAYIFSQRELEYEYIITNGDFEIAAIYAKTKRKELMHFGMDQVSIIAPVKSLRLDGENVMSTSYYASRKNVENEYAFIVNVNQKKIKVILELSEKSMNQVKTHAKHKFTLE